MRTRAIFTTLFRRTLDCESAAPLLGAWHDRELSGRADGLVRTHLEGCPSCRAEVNAIHRMSVAVKSAGDQMAEGMPNLAAMISYEAARRARLRSSGADTPLFERFSLAHAVAVAAMLVAIIATLVAVPIAMHYRDSSDTTMVESLEYASGNVKITNIDQTRSTVIWISDDDEAG